MNIIIMSYRISGNDGVSLECKHWKEILRRMGHKVTFLAGELDTAGVLIPELHFQWPNVMDIHDKVIYGKGNYKQVEDKVFDIAGTIEGKLRKFLNGKRKVDLLIVANALSLPMHFPLAVALTRVIEEFSIPTIARDHDFSWERKRYLKSDLYHFFERWFPPNIPLVKHVVINSESQLELKKRRNIDSVIISDSFDFSNKKLLMKDLYLKSFRKDFGIEKDDLVFLQATRIIPRKRIELSMKLIKKLNLPKAILIIAGHSGDEGKEYESHLKKLGDELGIRYKFIGDRVNSKRRIVAVADDANIPSRLKIYTLWDVYNSSDFVVYPTKIEGFGNQFIEAVYFKKPIIVTPYSVYKKDIAPLNFDVIEMSPMITNDVIVKINKVISNKNLRDKITEKNFKIGLDNYSYEATSKKIQSLILSFAK